MALNVTPTYVRETKSNYNAYNHHYEGLFQSTELDLFHIHFALQLTQNAKEVDQ